MCQFTVRIQYYLIEVFLVSAKSTILIRINPYKLIVSQFINITDLPIISP